MNVKVELVADELHFHTSLASPERRRDRESRGQLEIGCTAPMPTQPPQIKVNLCVFSTSVGTDAAIGRLQSGFPHSDPTITVEVTGDGQLRYLE